MNLISPSLINRCITCFGSTQGYWFDIKSTTQFHDSHNLTWTIYLETIIVCLSLETQCMWKQTTCCPLLLYNRRLFIWTTLITSYPTFKCLNVLLLCCRWLRQTWWPSIVTGYWLMRWVTLWLIILDQDPSPLSWVFVEEKRELNMFSFLLTHLTTI